MPTVCGAKKFILPGLALLLILLLPLSLGAEEKKAGQAMVDLLGELVWSLEGRLIYAMFMAMSLVLFVATVLAVWGVVELYVRIGSWVIPMYDFTTSTGPLGVGPEAVQGTERILVLMYGVSFVLLAILSQLSFLKSGSEGRSVERSFMNLALAFLMLLLIKPIYSTTIYVCDTGAKQVYRMMQGNRFESEKNQIFRAIFQANIFQEEYYRDDPDKKKEFKPEKPITPDEIWTDLWRDPIKVTDKMIHAMTPTPGLFFSRLVQLCLAVFGIIEIIFLLIAKGFQILALWIYLPLGVLSCAFLANDSTRSVFYSWLKGFIGVCLWSFLWALMIYGLHILAYASAHINGWNDTKGLGSMLFPFILFGALWKIKNVSFFLDSLQQTGQVAGAAMYELKSAMVTGVMFARRGWGGLFKPGMAVTDRKKPGGIQKKALGNADRVGGGLKKTAALPGQSKDMPTQPGGRQPVSVRVDPARGKREIVGGLMQNRRQVRQAQGMKNRQGNNPASKPLTAKPDKPSQSKPSQGPQNNRGA